MEGGEIRIEHVKHSDLACPCGCGMMPKPETITLLYMVYVDWGRPILCANAARCERYTKSLKKRGYKAATNSAHNVGLALDLLAFDRDIKEFQDFCRGKLEEWDAWMEDPEWTPNHVHLQKRRASARVFQPWSRK